MQLPALVSSALGLRIILVTYSAPDAANTARLQQLVDSVFACISVVVIPKELISSADSTRNASTIASALQGLPTPHTLSVLYATGPNLTAGEAAHPEPELSMHNALGAVQNSSGLTLAKVTARVRNAAQDIIGDDSREQGSLEDDEPLLAAGLNSAGAVQVVRLLEEAFDISLPDTLALDYPSVAEVAAHVFSLLPNASATTTANLTQDTLPAALSAATVAATAAALTTASAATSCAPSTTVPAAAPSAKARRHDLLKLVTVAASEAVRGQQADQPALTEPLMDAGLSSAGAVQLVSLLEASTGFELPGTLAFDYPSIAEITDHLLSLQPVASSTACPAGASRIQTTTHPVQAVSTQQGGSTTSFEAADSSQGGQTIAPEPGMTDLVFAAVKDALGLSEAEAPDLSLDSPLMEAGLNSALSMQLTAQLEAALQRDLPGTLVFDYPTIRELAIFLQSLSNKPSAIAAGTVEQSLEQNSTSVMIATEALQATVMGLVVDLTGEAVEVSTPLMDAGLTSASAVQLTAALEEALGIELPGTLVFDYPTVASLVAYLASCNTNVCSSGAAALSGQVAAQAAPSTSARAAVRDVVSAPNIASLVQRAVSMAAVDVCPEAIAIVGSAHRVPGGALQPQAYAMPADRITAVHLERWDCNQAALDSPSELNAAFGAFVSGAGHFDRAAFHLSGAEATLMDPQQRLLLETFAEAQQVLAQWDPPPTDSNRPAGNSGVNLKQQFGVYVGVSQLEYARITYETGSNLNAYYATGAHLSVTSGRVAYTFGLKGPAMAGTLLLW